MKRKLHAYIGFNINCLLNNAIVYLLSEKMYNVY